MNDDDRLTVEMKLYFILVATALFLTSVALTLR